MELKPDWYDAIARRISRRRFDGRPVPAELREQLEVFCDGANAPGTLPAPARACLVDDLEQTLFTGLVGGYGQITGTPLAAAFVGGVPGGGGEDVPGGDGDAPEDVQAAVGYLGEAFILEATRLGLGTCWIAGTFDHAVASTLAELAPGERVVAVTPLGYPTADQLGSERLLRTMIKASARLSVEKIAPGILDGEWPAWAVSAVQAARLAPSGANRQPWRFRCDGEALVMSRAEKLYWTSPIDLGIARLHVELGAAHKGVTGSWAPLPEPDVARFSPAG